jgi:hypothetical protein
LAQAVTATAAAGVPLPEITPQLTKAGIRFRRGQVTMIAAPPNGGKSLLALWYAVQHNLPTLYMSADTDDFTTCLRAAAMVTGQKVDEVEHGMLHGGEAYYEDALAELPNLRFCFEPTPSLDDVWLEVDAFAEMWGEPPALLVIDNLMNVQAESDNEWSGLREIAKALHHVARKTHAAVVVLHHVSENDSKPYLPAPRRAIQGKVSQLPEVILTVAMHPAMGTFKVACVKNRSGPHDATAEDHVDLFVDAPRMKILDSYGAWRASTAIDGWE